MAANPRTVNGHRRRQLTKWVKANFPICSLCHLPIDWDLKWYIDPKDGKRKLHPMSGEVDEIVPVSLGGDPLAKENLQGAHRICNQRKGNSLEVMPVDVNPFPTTGEF